MEITIDRQTSNQLYTEGRIFIDGELQTYTVESTEIMLPPGKYRLRLLRKPGNRRALVIQTPTGGKTGWLIDIDHSWIGSRKRKIIAIGQRFFPGAVFKSFPDYDNIVRQIEKCIRLKEPVEFSICDRYCARNRPFRHWLLGLVIAASCALTGCGGVRQAASPAPQVRSDTVYMSNYQYDSIYILQDKQTERSNDTVFIRDLCVEYRYQMLSDTICKTRVDSIPYPVTVTTVQEVPRPLTWFDRLTRACFWALAFTLGIRTVRIILKYRKL